VDQSQSLNRESTLTANDNRNQYQEAEDSELNKTEQMIIVPNVEQSPARPVL